jgi:hypothetical protein
VVEAQAPVATGSERPDMDIAGSASPEVSRAAEPALAALEAAALAAPRRVRRLVRPALPGWLSVIRAWTHTSRALLLGTLFTGAIAAAALVVLVVVGFAGVGTHNVPVLYGPMAADNSTAPGPQPPPESTHSVFGLPSPLLPEPSTLTAAISQSLSTVVLQPSDLGSDFTLLNGGPTGADAAAGLLGSYHAVYQRPLANAANAGRLSVATLTVVGIYRDTQTASFRLTDIAADRLGVEAGLPGLNATVVPARTVGDESRVLHLWGNSTGVDIGVYLVQFRRGSTDAIVGTAAVLGSESLDEALALADLQDGHIIAAALPVLRP